MDYGCAKLTVWEENVRKFEEGKKYKFSDVVVRSYNGVKYLSYSKESTAIEVAGIARSESDSELNSCEILGVGNYEHYHICLRCKAKFDFTTTELGNCRKCNLLQKVKHCKTHLSSKLLAKCDDDIYTLNASGQILSQIAGVEESMVTKEALLKVQPFCLTYKNNVVTSVTT